MRSVLYISYDGLTDSLGQSQILAYLKRLSSLDNKIVIISYEKESLYRKEGSKIREVVDANGLTWIPLKYTKRPAVVSTIFDIIKGFRTCKKLNRKHRFEIVHCRGYIAAVIGKKLKKNFGVKFIFDMRGWWPDEKLESGFWDKKRYKPVYNYFKKLEREFFQNCDYAVSLTYKGKEEIIKQNLAPEINIGVIPTCVDFEIFKAPSGNFKAEMRRQLNIYDEEKVFLYSGSVGGNYDPCMLIDAFLAFQDLYPTSYLLILSKDSLTPAIQKQFADAAIKRMSIYNAPFSKVTDYLRSADVGFIYYKMSFSTIGRSPTKLGEYWASGIPAIALKGIGDVDNIIGSYADSGISLSDDKGMWKEEMKALEFTDSGKLRKYSTDYFAIDKGVDFYDRIYQRLAPPIQTL
jgi:glycosyltransferase involved in cell wall biosynthesis